LNELRNLFNQSTRENVKNLLNTQIDKFQSDLTRLRLEQDRLNKMNSTSSTNSQTTTTGFTKKMYVVIVIAFKI
jgi:hypothetical protein